MNRYRTEPLWKFLLSASRNSLQSFELTRLSHAANLRKEINALLDQWLEESASALLARFLMEQREHPAHPMEAPTSDEATPKGGHRLSDNFLLIRRFNPRSRVALPEVMVAFRAPQRGWPPIVTLLSESASARRSVWIGNQPRKCSLRASARLHSARHSCARPPRPIGDPWFALIAPPLTYVMAALYLLGDTKIVRAPNAGTQKTMRSEK